MRDRRASGTGWHPVSGADRLRQGEDWGGRLRYLAHGPRYLRLHLGHRMGKRGHRLAQGGAVALSGVKVGTQPLKLRAWQWWVRGNGQVRLADHAGHRLPRIQQCPPRSLPRSIRRRR